MSNGFAALRHPGLLRFAAGRFASAVATTMVAVSLGFQLYEKTNSPLSLGMPGLIELIPILVLALPAGAAADRFRRRNVALLAHLALAACAVALMVITFVNGPVLAYYVVIFISGIAMAFRSPSVGSMLPQLVPAEDFSRANTLMSSSYELASISGPALAGFVIALSMGTSQWAFGIAAVAHLFFVGVLVSLPSFPPAVSKTRARKLSDYFVGLRFVTSVRIFLAAITLDLFAVLLGGAVALLPAFAKHVLFVGPVGLGWLRAAPAVGALMMALVQFRLPGWQRPGRVLLITVFGFGLATIGFGVSRVFWLSFLMLFLSGVFDNVSVVIRSTLEQSLTPDVMRGRVSAIHYVFIGMSNELGAFESGLTGELFGPTFSVIGGGIGVILVVTAVAWVWPELSRVPPLATLRPLPAPADA